MATVLITGGTGMIGRALSLLLLEKKYDVIILSRNPTTPAHKPVSGRGQQQREVQRAETGNLSYAQWNIHQQTMDHEAIVAADYIIHLAGAGIADKRWTEKRKKEIVNSRVDSGKLLVKSIREIPNKIKAVISASGIGWYGPDPTIPNPDPFLEEASSHTDFLGKACKEWEASIEPVVNHGKRLVKLRTGIVLSNEGGALPEFEKPLRIGVAAILGKGNQIISWIHIDDLVRLYFAAIEKENLSGACNAVAPNPVSNKDFALQLARITRGRFLMPMHVPTFVLKLVLGELSTEVLKSATVSCKKIQDTGFVFSYSTLDSALKSLK